MSTTKKVWILIASIIGVIVVVFASWGFAVVTSGFFGSGNAIIKKNTANNRIAAQERFEQLYQDIKAADRRITQAKAASEAKPKDKTLLTNYTGTVNFCYQLVADYNANSRKYTQEDFRAIDLPYQIDSYDQTTDCKE